LNIIKVGLGILLAFVILAGGGGAIAFFFANRLMGSPPKPTFANDYPPKKPSSPSSTPKKAASPAATPASPTPTETATPKPSLPAGAYEGRVTWAEGLTLRDAPSTDGSTLGGIDYNTPVVVLEESQDGVWQKVRVVATEQEGWVKAGNVERNNDDTTGTQ
jgi:hypothetical protein